MRVLTLSINSIVEKYLEWNDREKWLLLRKIAYQQLRNRFFSSLQNIQGISWMDFKRYYLNFGLISIGGFRYKLTVDTISDFLRSYTVSKLKELVDRGEVEVIGNASWSQLHMGFRKDKWHDVKKGISYLLFGEQNRPVSRVDGSEVITRLRRVMEWDLSVVGFGRAKVTITMLT